VFSPPSERAARDEGNGGWWRRGRGLWWGAVALLFAATASARRAHSKAKIRDFEQLKQGLNVQTGRYEFALGFNS